MVIEPVVIGDAVLYCADCREVLPILGEGSVEAVITDPPFGIDFKYETHNDTPEGYGAWLWSIIEQCEQKAKPGSPVFVWQAMLNVRKFAEWFPRDWRIFAACKNFVQMRSTTMQYAVDPVVVWWTPGETYSEGTLSRDFHVANTAPIAGGHSEQVKGHPCPRPLHQVAHIVNQWVRPHGTVLDPFAGSGTTGVACTMLGRGFIGIEIDEIYFSVMVQRITEAQMQLRLGI